MKRTIAVDFDGVIHKYSAGWHDGSIYDSAVERAFSSLIKLQENYEVVIFTTRKDHDAIRNWMLREIKFEIISKAIATKFIEEIKITNEKPLAFAYIDDRAIRFINWKDTLNYF